ncbi:MAG TPA: glycosyltransferase [Candidatus Eisenbacteria bacterium]|nr:glycosyltransferase [Candidatus Eisenbacteria bacterium]
MKTVCFFGAFDPGYPRNRILRSGLRRAGLDVVEARAAPRRAWRRWPALAAAWARVARDADVMLVPEFRHKDVPLAVRLRGRRPLVFDPLVSRWDTLVGDWALHAPGSLQARWNRGLDRWALRAADLLLCDTWAHGELFVELGARRERLRRVPVGAEDAFFAVPPPPAEGPLRIVYVGGFLPLHGVPVIVEAAARLEARARRLPPFAIQLVGRGIEFEAARRLAAERGLTSVEFPGPLAYADAPRVLEGAHVALGVFGAGAKAARVVPHKLWQALAAGRAVVSGDGAAVRELFTPGEHLLLVERGNPEALAEALAALLADAGRRAALAESGRARALELGTPDAVGRTLAEAIAGMAA